MLTSCLKKTLWCLCTAMIVVNANVGFADQESRDPKEKNVPVESRTTPLSERIEKQESAAKEEEEQLSEVKKSKLDKEEQPQTKAIFQTSHYGVFHYCLWFDGITLTLEDGSVWSVKKNDRKYIANWSITDEIVISPNKNFFVGAYGYVMNNQTTGDSVSVYMTLGPLYMGPFTKYITTIDYYENTIILSDGSVWDMSGWDSGLVKNWLIGDTVVIGLNTGSLKKWNPNILINVNTYTYARGECVKQ